MVFPVQALRDLGNASIRSRPASQQQTAGGVAQLSFSYHGPSLPPQGSKASKQKEEEAEISEQVVRGGGYRDRDGAYRSGFKKCLL